MNRDEAQFILRAYRSNSADAHDPQFQAALALAKQDPELARWFAEEQAVDAVFGRKIRSGVQVPPDLKRQLLLVRSTARTTSRWHLRPWLAIAATFVILAVSSGAWWRQRSNERQSTLFREAMAQASLDMTSHADVHGLDGEPLRHWLLEHRGEPNFVLPAGLAGQRVAACKIIDWQGSKVTMLCFKVDGVHLDLFVVDAAQVPSLFRGAAPQLASATGLGTATWSREGKVYVLVGNRPPAELQRFI